MVYRALHCTVYNSIRIQRVSTLVSVYNLPPRLHVEQSVLLTFHASAEDISEIVFTIKRYLNTLRAIMKLQLYTQVRELNQRN